jgi:GNAT superfamily N-acetyltransferase
MTVDIDKVVIREYHHVDRNKVKTICCDTGYFGNPIDPIFSDREAFADSVVGYYLRKEPHHAYVAQHDGEVVGYFLGSTNQHVDISLALNAVWPMMKAVNRWITGQYQDDPQNIEFLKWMFLRAPKEMPKHPKKSAHGHFNLTEDYRHQGLGIKLFKTFLEGAQEEIARKGIDTLYGDVFTTPKKDEEYFTSRGIDIHDSKRSTLFSGEGFERKALCITKRLDELF